MGFLDQANNALNKVFEAAMSTAANLPVASGSEGGMLALGAINAITNLYRTAEASASSMVGLASVDAGLREAALRASVAREQIAADLKKAAMQKELGEEQLAFEKEKLNRTLSLYQQTNDAAQTIIETAQGIAADNTVVGDNESSPSNDLTVSYGSDGSVTNITNTPGI